MRDRELAIDQFRGLAIFLMLPVNFLEHVRAAPAWLKHAPDVGLTLADFVAPFFIFAIGLTFRASVLRRREREGLQKALEHTVKRALALIGLGALFTLGEQSYGFNHGQPWGTLQAIGAAIVLTLPTLWLPWPGRLGVALAVLAGYQFMLGHGWLELVLAASHAGLWGALSWGALLMIATVFADLRQQPARWFPLAFALLLLGGALAFVFPVSKHRMSVSFDLIVSGSAALVFAATAALVKARGPLSALVTWGQNPLVLYVSHLMLLSVFLVPEAPWWHAEAGLALTAVQGLAFLGALHLWARLLERRQIFIAL